MSRAKLLLRRDLDLALEEWATLCMLEGFADENYAHLQKAANEAFLEAQQLRRIRREKAEVIQRLRLALGV